MLRPNIQLSKSNFLAIDTRIEIHGLNWLMAFFVFASSVVLLGDRLPPAVRQYSFQVFLLVAIVSIVFIGWRPLLGLNRKSLRFILIVFGIYFVGLKVIDLVAAWAGYESLPRPAPQRSDLILLAVLAPILEEIFFRDLIFRSLLHRLQKLWLAIFLSSILFMVAHLTLYPGAFLLGLINCLFLIYSRNLWTSILFHSVSNLSLIFFPIWFPNLLTYLETSGLFSQFYR